MIFDFAKTYPGVSLREAYRLSARSADKRLEKPEVRTCQVRTVRRIGYSNRRMLSEKFSEAFERWTRQLSICELSRRECGLPPPENTASGNGSNMWLRKYSILWLCCSVIRSATWNPLITRMTVNLNFWVPICCFTFWGTPPGHALHFGEFQSGPTLVPSHKSLKFIFFVSLEKWR
jgi:hypothetical protein